MAIVSSVCFWRSYSCRSIVFVQKPGKVLCGKCQHIAWFRQQQTHYKIPKQSVDQRVLLQSLPQPLHPVDLVVRIDLQPRRVAATGMCAQIVGCHIGKRCQMYHKVSSIHMESLTEQMAAAQECADGYFRGPIRQQQCSTHINNRDASPHQLHAAAWFARITHQRQLACANHRVRLNRANESVDHPTSVQPQTAAVAHEMRAGFDAVQPVLGRAVAVVATLRIMREKGCLRLWVWR